MCDLVNQPGRPGDRGYAFDPEPGLLRQQIHRTPEDELLMIRHMPVQPSPAEQPGTPAICIRRTHDEVPTWLEHFSYIRQRSYGIADVFDHLIHGDEIEVIRFVVL